MSLYRNILKQAAQLVWRYKFLWFFGFFAAFLGGFGEYEVLLNRADAYFAEDLFVKTQSLQELKIFSGEFWNGAARVFQAEPIASTILVIVILILLSLLVFLVWLGVVSQVGLISSTYRLMDSKKNSSKVNIQKGVEEGVRHFWPVFGLNILSKALIYLIFFCLSLVFLFVIPQKGEMLTDILYIGMFIVLMVITLIAAFVFKYASCYVVIEKRRFLDSIKRGWDLFLKNWIITLEMALILFLITFAATLVLIIASLVVAIPIYLLVNLLLIWGSSNLSFWIVIAIMILLTVFISVAGGIIIAFQISSWTTLFLRLTTQKNNLSKVFRWFGQR